ncbi:21345_t:CDS:2, partial [Racocetra persica]
MWTVKVLSIFLEPLFDSVPNIKISWYNNFRAKHHLIASKARMNVVKKTDQDYWKKKNE